MDARDGVKHEQDRMGLVVLTVTTAGDIDTAFTAMAQNGVGALLVGSVGGEPHA